MIEKHVEQILDFVSDELSKNTDPKKIIRYLDKFRMDHSSERTRIQQIEGTKLIISIIVNKLNFLLRVLLNTSPFIDEQLKYLKSFENNEEH